MIFHTQLRFRERESKRRR